MAEEMQAERDGNGKAAEREMASGNLRVVA